jgi:hypothetical protein
MSTEIVPPTVPPASKQPDTRPVPSTSTPDRCMRRILRLPEGATATAAEAQSAFQKSLFISATRCVLMYIFFPFILPLIGVAKGVGPAIGLVIGLLAVVSITFSIRRFWRANHSKRWHYTVFGTTIIFFLFYAAIVDLRSLLT